MNLIRYSYPRTSSLVSASGRSPWQGLESEFDRLIETALGELAPAGSPHRFLVDLHEDKDNAYLRAELPGVSREDITVEMVNGYLSINAERKTTDDDGKVMETFSLNRSVAIPHEVQADKITAGFEHGILTVTLPKCEETKPKKITVQVK